MTNFDWLCIENKLEEFLTCLVMYGGDAVNKKFHIEQLSEKTFPEDIAWWLNAEHKEEIHEAV